jgi:hypothetical protein
LRLEEPSSGELLRLGLGEARGLRLEHGRAVAERHGAGLLGLKEFHTGHLGLHAADADVEWLLLLHREAGNLRTHEPGLLRHHH